eukprot:10876408-Ditylum_brightwellii.AAC.1
MSGTKVDLVKIYHTLIANSYPLHYSVKEVAFNWIEECSASLKMPHFHDAPTDASAHQIVLIKKCTKKGSIKNTLEYTKASDWENTKFDMIADIFHKTEHEDQHANLFVTTIKLLLQETLNSNGFHSSTSRLILEAVMFKSTVFKKLRESVQVLCMCPTQYQTAHFMWECQRRCFTYCPSQRASRTT